MTTAFPTALDNFTNPTESSYQDTLSHAGQHSDINDAVEALEAKVGITDSADTNSLDYKSRSTKSYRFPRKMGWLGDSIARISYNPSIPTGFKSWFNQGPATWVRILSRQTVDITPDTLQAVNGATTGSIISGGYLDAVIAEGCDVCVVAVGINDAAGSVAASTTQANYTTIVNSLIASGCSVILQPALPDSLLTSDQRNLMHTNNAFLREMAYTTPGVTLSDPTPYYIDTSSATGAPATGITYDGLHPASMGAYLIGRTHWNTIQNLFPFFDSRFMDASDLYNATTNITGNLLANGLLEGTSGSKSGTSGTPTGDVATSWTAFTGNPAGTAACACTKVAQTGGETGVWQQFELSGTPANVGAYSLRQNITTNYTPGDVVVTEAEFEIDSGFTNITGIMLTVFDAGSSNIGARDGVITAGQPLYTGDTIRGVLKSEPHTVGAASTVIQIDVSINFDAAAVAATVRLGRISVRKVVSA